MIMQTPKQSVKFKKILLLLFFITFFTKPAFAYIDPGTTSIIISALVGFFVTAGFYIRNYYNKTKDILKKLSKKLSRIK